MNLEVEAIEARVKEVEAIEARVKEIEEWLNSSIRGYSKLIEACDQDIHELVTKKERYSLLVTTLQQGKDKFFKK